ncbi:MAG: hypothetical protein KDD44_14775, partial [Bdellovibrionales bacterium]|nr:hypothetical protein [Bdellovibrionales bacterium]
SERRFESAFTEELKGIGVDAEAGLLRLVRELSPSASHFRQMLQQLRDVSRRDDTSLSSLLADPGLLVLLDAAHPRQEKLTQVRRWISRRRFPERVRIEERAEQLMGELVKRHGVRLQLPEELEGDSLELARRLRSIAEVQKLAERLSSLAGDPELEELFELLCGREAGV